MTLDYIILLNSAYEGEISGYLGNREDNRKKGNYHLVLIVFSFIFKVEKTGTIVRKLSYVSTALFLSCCF